MTGNQTANHGTEHSMAGLRPFSQSLPMALQRARESTMRLFRPMLADHGLTEQQWRVLRALAATERPLEVSALAERTFLLGPSLSRILANLERRELVVRERVVNDQRRATITLSEAGWETVRGVAPQSEAIYARIEALYGSRQLQALLADLERLTEIDTEFDRDFGTDHDTASKTAEADSGAGGHHR